MSVIIFNYFTKHVIEVDENPKTSIKLLVCYGVGVWVSVWKQPSIKLFHSETLKHVQDISIASPVTNMQRGQFKYRLKQKIKPEIIKSKILIPSSIFGWYVSLWQTIFSVFIA